MKVGRGESGSWVQKGAERNWTIYRNRKKHVTIMQVGREEKKIRGQGTERNMRSKN